MNNFKSSSNKKNRLSALKRIVNSLHESVCYANVDDVMIKIYRLRVYYSRIKRILLEKKSGPETVEVMKLKWSYYEKYFFLCDKMAKLNSKLSSYMKDFNYFMKVPKRFLSTLFLKEKFHHL